MGATGAGVIAVDLPRAIGCVTSRVGILRRGWTLADFWDRIDDMWGDRVLVIDDGVERTAASIAADVDRWSRSLAGRIEAGRPVVLAMPNSYDLFLASFAVARAGGIAVPVNDQMTDREVEHVVADAGSSTLVHRRGELGRGPRRAGGSGRAGVRRPPVPAHPDEGDVGALFYTSGTTGLPKGAALTHRALVGHLAISALAPPGVVGAVVVALPVAHIMGFATLAGFAASGTVVRFSERFVASDVLDTIESARPAAFIGVPTMYRRLEAAGAAERDLSSVRFWMSGADAMPTDLIRRFKSYGSSVELPVVGPIGEAAFVEGYGMVEVGGGVAVKMSPPLMPLGIGDSLGFRLPGYRFRVVGEGGHDVPPGMVGELWVSGPGVLKGYWNDPEATARVLSDDGWLRTGDLVRRGPAGTVVFCGRAKTVIKSGGYSVYPLEVETALCEHPDVAEAAVAGHPHPELGEVPVAAVIARRGASIDPAALATWIGGRVAHYKVPRLIAVVDELPRTGTAKVNRSAVAAIFAD